MNKKTCLRKWKWGVAAITLLRDDKIKFNPSDFPEDQIYLLSFDGVNSKLNEPRVQKELVAVRSLDLTVVPPKQELGPGSHLYDHKSNSARVSYKMDWDLFFGRLVAGALRKRYCTLRGGLL